MLYGGRLGGPTLGYNQDEMIAKVDPQFKDAAIVSPVGAHRFLVLSFFHDFIALDASHLM